MAASDALLADLIQQNANLFASYAKWSDGQVMVLAGTVNDPNSYDINGQRNGDLGYYPVTDVNNVVRYIPCLARLREIARSCLVALTIAALRTIPIPTNGAIAQLHDGGRAGLFRYDSSDLSAKVAIDVDAALYVAPTARPDGKAGAWVRVRLDGDYLATWTGVSPATENADVYLNRLMGLMTPGDWLVLPPYEMGISGKVTIPLGINVRGFGRYLSGLKARTATNNFHAVHCRYGVNILRDFYAGGVKGQLTVGEAACFHAYPGEINQPATVTADIANMLWENLRATDAETGFRWGFNVTDTEGNGRLYHARASEQINCDSDGILGHNVELFAPDEITVDGGDHYMVLTDAAGAKAKDPPKMVRIIGPRRVKISRLRLYGHGGTSLVGGVHFELASPYSKANYWSLPGDVEVLDVSISGCPTAVNIPSGTQGAIVWKGGIIRGIPGQLSIAFRIGATGYLIQPQVVRDSPPPDTAAGEKGYKVSTHRLRFEDTTLFDCDEIARIEGKIDLATFERIENYAPQVVAGRYAFTFDKGGNDLDIYRVRIRDVRDYANRNVPTFIRVNDGRKGSEISVDDCVASMTQNTAQRWPVTASATALANVAIRFRAPDSVRRILPAVAASIAANLVERDPA